jgi:hypothetical protein
MMPMTSTAVTRPIAKHNGNHQMSQKRKLPDDPTSELTFFLHSAILKPPLDLVLAEF